MGKDLINEKGIFCRFGYAKRSIMLAKRTSIEKISFWFNQWRVGGIGWREMEFWINQWRVGWREMELLLDMDDPVKLPSTCACGENFNRAHALYCPKGGYTHLRHNDIPDSFANLLNEVGNDVKVEPCLQTLQGEPQIQLPLMMTTLEYISKPMASLLHVSAERFLMKMFYPYAKSCPKSIPDSYKYHESIKKLK